MKRLFVVLFLLGNLSSMGFHIVGGEIEFITIAPGLYRINVIQYFDEAQDENPGPEGFADVYIYSNSTDKLVSTHRLLLQTQEPVFYTNQECSIEELQTSRVVWSRDSIELNPRLYDDPKGYYVVWERCCRNATIVNILNPSATGMKYVVEIPPLWKNDKPFINSSPILFKPLSDYACVDQLYYIEFTGTDPDGDSLVYSLTEPLNTVAQVAIPVPQPKPHIVKNYAPGYSSIIPGKPSLNISSRGLLTVNPNSPGLYVFSVLVDEYRNGEKIGQVQRDFQMLVIDGCNPPDPPEVGIKIPGRDDFQPELDTLQYELADDKCFQFIVKNIGAGDTIDLKAEGVNFEGAINEIFEFQSTFIGEGQDSLLVEVCAPGCPPLGEDPFTVNLIAADDACPLPQLDTLQLTMQVEPPPNEFPIWESTPPKIFLEEDGISRTKIIGTDADGDELDISISIEDIDDVEARGFFLEVLSNEPGYIEAELSWDTDCTVYDFSDQTEFDIEILIDDADTCDIENPNILKISHEVVLPPNSDPEISLAVAEGSMLIEEDKLEADLDETIILDVTAIDRDGDSINLSLLEDPFLDLNVQFENAEGAGSVTSRFIWDVDCNLLEPDVDNLFQFQFVADDNDKCKIKNFDTLELEVRIIVPFNNAPELERYPDYTLEVNKPFSLDIFAEDIDDDSVYLEFFSGAPLPESESLSFEPSVGIGQVSSELKWTPECSLLKNGEPTFYDLVFVSYDTRCPGSKLDTTKITFLLQETRIAFEEFIPPNAFSPNGDGINDVFRLSNLTPDNQNLPIDNCDDFFQFISIHDRTGKKVFYSESKDFQWDGDNLPSGVYYYLVKYSKSEYRSYIQLLR